MLSVHFEKDDDEDSKDGTEVTEEVSDFFSDSSSSLSTYEDDEPAESFVSGYCESFCEEQTPQLRAPPAYTADLCRELIALAGGMAGFVAIVNI